MNIHPMLEPFGRRPGEIFDRAAAFHLLSRAAFGGTPEEVAVFADLGAEKAVERLLAFPDQSAEEQAADDTPDFSGIDDLPRTFGEQRRALAGMTPDDRKAFQQKIQKANRELLMATGDWWLGRMDGGKFPLQEKLALFWHGHFTTSAKDERMALLIWRQNELLRKFAAGDFKQFVKRIGRDPAMLDYLNNNDNRKAHPNENYARELMELFTLGIGNYTETDVKESARAFTGWAHEGDEFTFRKFQHDFGRKTILGRTGDFDGDDVVEMIVRQRACAEFICRKLYAFFVTEEPDGILVRNLATMLRENDFNLRPVIGALLCSRAFFRPEVVGGRIKSPVELVVGTARLLGMRPPGVKRIMAALNQMGQTPFMPPNVKGWPVGRDWINSATLLARYNTGVTLAGLVDVDRIIPDAPADAMVDGLLERMIGRAIDPAKRAMLVSAMAGDSSKPARRRLAQWIAAMPDYQLG